MKAGLCHCPKCKVDSFVYLLNNEYYGQCEKCGQWNKIADEAFRISGMCPFCAKPYDDHAWEGNKVKQPCVI
jgi:predicted ATP-dependent serine protease